MAGETMKAVKWADVSLFLAALWVYYDFARKAVPLFSTFGDIRATVRGVPPQVEMPVLASVPWQHPPPAWVYARATAFAFFIERFPTVFTLHSYALQASPAADFSFSPKPVVSSPTLMSLFLQLLLSSQQSHSIICSTSSGYCIGYWTGIGCTGNFGRFSAHVLPAMVPHIFLNWCCLPIFLLLLRVPHQVYAWFLSQLPLPLYSCQPTRLLLWLVNLLWNLHLLTVYPQRQSQRLLILIVKSQ